LHAQIDGAYWILDPPCRPIFKQGGGVQNRGRTSPTVLISMPGSMVMKTIPDPPPPPPPRPSTFKRRGGVRNPICSFRRLRSRRPDQRCSCSPTLLSYLVINQCGPSSCHFILPSSFPLLPCVIHSPLLLDPRGSPFFPTSTHFLPRVSFLSTSVSHPKANPSPPIFLLHLMSSTMDRTLSSFSHSIAPPAPYNPTPPSSSCASSSTLASMLIPQTIRLFQVAVREVFCIPKC
jgi:hypothetical protein